MSRMSEEKVGVVRGFFEARREGREGVFDFLSPGVEWETRSDFPDSQTFIGHDGIRALQDRFGEVVDDIWFQPDEFIPAGEHVMVSVRWGGRGRGSGVVFEERSEAWIFTVRDRAITRVREYGSKEACVDAFRLLEQDAQLES